MPSRNVSSDDVAQEHLVKSARRFQNGSRIIPSIYTRLTPQEIYDYLLVNWADHKGNAALAYGSIGHDNSATVGFDFGIFVCPGVVNLSLNATVSITDTEEAVFLIHRSMPSHWTTLATRKSESQRFINNLSVDKPVGFMVMRGYSHGERFKLSFAAAASSSVIPDILPLGAFGFTLGGAELSATYTQNRYKYTDERPGWYFSGRDSKLLEDFSNSLGTRNSHYIKREAVGWLKHVKKNYVDPRSGPRYAKLKDEFKSLPSFAFPGFRASSRKVNKKLHDLLKALDDDLPKNQKTILHNHIVHYEKEIARSRAAQSEFLVIKKGGREKEHHSIDGLCRINLVNKKGEGTFKVSIGDSPAEGAMGGGSAVGIAPEDPMKAALTLGLPTVTLGAGATMNYKRVYTVYRYQTYAFSKTGKRIVYSQDVKIRYIEKDVTAAMQAGLDAVLGRDVDLTGIHVIGQDLSTLNKVKTKALNGKSWTKRSMYYRSIAAYWVHSRTEPRPKVRTLNGSGISFGLSIHLQDLISLSYADHKGASNKFMEAQVKDYAKLLKVTVKQFRTFVKGLLTGKSELDFRNEITGFKHLEDYSSVLVESSFRFTGAVDLDMEKSKDDFSKNDPADMTKNTQWKNFYEGKSDDTAGAGLELEAMRVRVRLGDHTSNSRSTFRLGIYVFGSGFGVDLNKTEAAGNEGIFELHTHYFIDSDQAEKRISKNLRDGVPPVMLIPHHFNE